MQIMAVVDDIIVLSVVIPLMDVIPHITIKRRSSRRDQVDNIQFNNTRIIMVRARRAGQGKKELSGRGKEGIYILRPPLGGPLLPPPSPSRSSRGIAHSTRRIK